MNISDEGVRLVCSFEGYHKKLANGDCTAYRTNLGNGKYDIPTIGYGCTVGIKIGDIWTEEKARDELKKELSKHEAYVTQYVTVPINQNEFDALVSFSYNCGAGNLKKLVARLNKGDRVATAKAFLLYVKAQGQTLPGLVSRRTRESALFQKPVAAPEEPAMPQTVSKSREPLTEKVAATGGVGLTLLAQQVAAPAQRFANLETLETVVQTGQRARGASLQARELGMWAFSLASWPYLLGGAAAAGGLYWFLCKYLPSKLGTPS